MQFGPVGEAAHGGHSSATFDLSVGLAVLALTWIGFWRKEERTKKNFWAAVGVTAICAVFICVGIRELSVSVGR
jgi:hypothetical protein